MIALLGGCTSSASTSSPTTAPKIDVTVVRLNQAAVGTCSYVREYLLDVNTFSKYGKLADLAARANDQVLRVDGKALAAVENPRNQAAVDAVMVKLLQTCTHAGLIKTPPAVATEPITQSNPPEAGFRGQEDFCVAAPLTGHILYDATTGGLTRVLTVAVGGLPSNSEVYVDWSNDHVRGYIIASFQTDSAGTANQSSVNVGRLAEVRGVEIVLESTSVPPTSLWSPRTLLNWVPRYPVPPGEGQGYHH
jgi:hypothetical protein